MFTSTGMARTLLPAVAATFVAYCLPIIFLGCLPTFVFWKSLPAQPRTAHGRTQPSKATFMACFPALTETEKADRVCIVCRDDFDLPVKLTCGHVTCLECVKAWFDREQNRCPECLRTLFVQESPSAVIAQVCHPCHDHSEGHAYYGDRGDPAS